MSTEVPLQCACGKLQGAATVSASAGTRIVCHCRDCQAFARFLGRPEIMDDRGGTDIYQMAPARVRLTSSGPLACVRLSGKGMFRWYCADCKTPVGNTLGPKMPFVGLIGPFMALDPDARDRTLGPPIAHIQTQSALGDGVPDPGTRVMLRMFARIARLLGTWWLTRAGVPSPFFDEKTGAPRAVPRILAPEERRALDPPVFERARSQRV